MNSQQVQDISLMYEAVYNDELREKAEEYNNQVTEEDIVEVATEYFYTYGLNSDGIDILIEKVGLDNFVEFVYSLSEDLMVLNEARSGKSRIEPVTKDGKSVGSLTGGQKTSSIKRLRKQKEARKKSEASASSEKPSGLTAALKSQSLVAAKEKSKKAAQERKETERKEPESKGADTEARKEQPKSKKPIRDVIARQILAGMERHRKGMETLGKLASVTHEAGRRAGEHVKKHGWKSLANEEFEYWVNSLIEEGYDLSDYTWDDMYDIYLDEAAKRTPRKQRGAIPSDKEWQNGRSDAGKRISGDENTGPRHYTLGRAAEVDAPTKPGARPKNTPKLAGWEKDDIQYRKANLKAGKTHKVGGERGLPESFDNFDVILEYLIAEGYADTNEAALVIMANMSEDWREEILDEEVRGAKKGTIRSVIEKGGKSIKYVQSGGDIVAGDRAAAERASAADRTRSGRNRANAARAEQARKKSIQNLNAKSGEDSGDYDSGYYGDDDTSDGKRHYSLSHTNRDARRRRASGR